MDLICGITIVAWEKLSNIIFCAQFISDSIENFIFNLHFQLKDMLEAGAHSDFHHLCVDCAGYICSIQ